MLDNYEKNPQQSELNINNTNSFHHLAVTLDDSVNKILSERASRAFVDTSGLNINLDILQHVEYSPKTPDKALNPIDLYGSYEYSLLTKPPKSHFQTLEGKKYYEKKKLPLIDIEDIKLVSSWVKKDNTHPCSLSGKQHISIVGYENGRFAVCHGLGKNVQEFKGKSQHRVTAIDISTNEKYALLGFENGQLELWNLKKSSRQKTIKSIHYASLTSVKFWKDTNKYLITADETGKTMLIQYKKKVLSSKVTSIELTSSGLGGIVSLQIFFIPDNKEYSSLLAIIGNEKIIIMCLEPKIEVVFAVDRDIDIADLAFPCAKWFLYNNVVILAVSWGDYMSFYRFMGNPEEMFVEVGSLNCEKMILQIFWMSDKIVCGVLNDDSCIVVKVRCEMFDGWGLGETKTGMEERKDAKNAVVIRRVSLNCHVNGQGWMRFCSRKQHCYGNVFYQDCMGIFFLSSKGLMSMTLLTWEGCLDSLISKQDWLGALSLSLSFYSKKHQKVYFPSTSPVFPLSNIKSKIESILKSYSQLTSIPLKYRITNSIEVSLSIQSYDLIYIDLYENFMTENSEQTPEIFIRTLEFFVLHSQLDDLPAIILGKMIQFYTKSNELSTFETLLLHLNPEKLKPTLLLPICEDHLLSSAYIYTSTCSKLKDFIKPLKILYKFFKFSLEKTQKTLSAYKILWYIKLIANQQTFPIGEIQQDNFSHIILSVSIWLLKSTHMLEMLKIDSSSTLFILSLLFEYNDSDTCVDKEKSIRNLLGLTEGNDYFYYQVCLFTTSMMSKYYINLPVDTVINVLYVLVTWRQFGCNPPAWACDIFEYVQNAAMNPNGNLYGNYSLEDLDKVVSRALKKTQGLNGDNIEKLYKASQFSVFTQVQIVLSSIKKEFRNCLDFFVKSQSQKVRNKAFTWINKQKKSLEKLDFKNFAKVLEEYLALLGNINIEKTENIVFDMFNDRIPEVIRKAYVAPRLQKRVIEKWRQKLPDDLVVLYVGLLCEYESSKIIGFLEELAEDTSEETLRKCIEKTLDFKKIDPACYLLERQHRISEAFQLFYSRSQDIKDRLLKNPNLDIKPYISDILSLINLCSNNFEDLTPIEFEAFILKILLSIIDLTYKLPNNFQQEIQSLLITTISSAVNHISLNKIITKLCEKYPKIPLKFIKSSISHVFVMKNFMHRNLRSTLSLLNEDVEKMSKELYIKNMKGIRIGEFCSGCNMLLQSESGPSMKIVVFVCGHRFHDKCLESRKCSVCVEKETKRSTIVLKLLNEFLQ